MATHSKPVPIGLRVAGEPLFVGRIVERKKKKYKVVPGYKHARRGETLVFKHYSDVNTLKIEGAIFDHIAYPQPGEVQATLKSDLAYAFHPYRAICDGGTDAEGGSPPTVIIDP